MRYVKVLIAFVSFSGFALSACSPEYAAEEPAGASVSQAETVMDQATFPADINLNEPLSLVGTEPFWGVKIANGAAVVSRMDQVEASFATDGFKISGDTASLQSGELSIVLTAIPCSDGMSDRNYPLTAEVRIGEEVLKGCAMPTAELMANPV